MIRHELARSAEAPGAREALSALERVRRGATLNSELSPEALAALADAAGSALHAPDATGRAVRLHGALRRFAA
jgi:hypothetical protein